MTTSLQASKSCKPKEEVTTPQPPGKMYSEGDFKWLCVLGRGSFGKVGNFTMPRIC